MASTQQQLPLHKAWKAVQYVDQAGESHFPSQPNGWKFETFIFDWLERSNKVAVLMYPRERCFAPLKNATGDYSPETVKQALLRRDREVLREMTGLEPPNFPFELPAEFY